jgi:hypothetical protein
MKGDINKIVIFRWFLCLVLFGYKQKVQSPKLSQGTAYAKVFPDFPQSFQGLPKMLPQIRA